MPNLRKCREFLHNFRHLNSMKLELQQLREELNASEARYEACIRSETEALRQELAAAQVRYEALLAEQARLCEALEAAQQSEVERQAIANALREELQEQLQSAREADEARFMEALRSSQEDQRRTLKRQLGLSARVVFLCELPSLWNSFRTVVAAMKEDSRFEVILVNLWCRVYDADGSFTYQHADFHGIEEEIGQSFVESCDPISDQWLDLEAMQPDYVFYMRPYDYYRHPAYHIEAVSKYARTCYIPYGMSIIGGEVEKFALPVDFCSRLYYFFLNNPFRKEYVLELLGFPSNLDDAHFLYLGYPRLDLIRAIREKSVERGEGFTLLWLPRWNTRENLCSFFEYKDILPEYASNHPGCCLILRPHPLCFQEFLRTGELTPEELDALKRMYAESSALRLDEESDYLPSFRESDVLVADATSLIAEYFATGKPIIFCKKEDKASLLMRRLSPGMYIVEDRQELLETLDALRQGIDPLKEVREALIQRDLLPPGEPAGVRIREEIAGDYLGKNEVWTIGR